MCGIFGYVGRKNATDVILEGLKRLEYRGYDSWGIAVCKDSLQVVKKVGAIGDLIGLSSLPAANIGIGHTRWATHGGVVELNAHPHFSTDKSFVLAQNGIVENHEILREKLKNKNYKFISETDTEVIVRLLENKLKTKNNLELAVRDTFLELEGRNTIIILTKNNQIIAARNGSPLIIGINSKTDETFFSSDTLSFAPYVDKILVVDNGQIVNYQNKKIVLKNIKSGKILKPKYKKLNMKADKVDKEGYDHFMLKEINESAYVIRQLLNQNYDKKFISQLKKAKRVYTIGSGTAGIAASQIAFYLRTFAKINANSLIGADAREYQDLFTKDDLIIAPSQSGETADVLEVLEVAKKKGVKIATFVNMQGSTMSRIADYSFMANAGPEICVMSTKIFISQISWGYLISKIAAGKKEKGVENLKYLIKQIEEYLSGGQSKTVKKLAKDLVLKKDIFLLGKYQNLNIIYEGMVKIIEGSYKHAHGLPAGDLKHYAITLVEKGVPVIAVVSNDVVKADVLNAVNEVKSRGAQVIGIASEFNKSFDHFLQVPDTGETSAIMNTIPLQLLAYYLAFCLGNNIDKPRNIAKSVTVK